MTTQHDVIITKFSATWCKPCKQIQPLWEQFSNENKEVATFIEYDTDEVPDIVMQESIKTVPTFIAYRKGKGEIARLSGTSGATQMRANFQKLLKQAMEA